MGLTGEQKEKLEFAFRAVGIDLDNLIEAIKKFCEAIVIRYTDFEEAMEQVANMIRADAAQAEREAEELAELEEYVKRLGLQATRERKKKRERERRMAAKLGNTIKFSGYSKGRLCWAVKRRTRPRPRERGPPAKRTDRSTAGKE